ANRDISVDHVRITVYYTPPTLLVSGNAYAGDGAEDLTACDGSTKNIAVVVGTSTPGKFTTNCADSGNNFSVTLTGTTALSADTPIIAYIDGVANVYGTTAALYDGLGDQTGLTVRQNRLVLSSDTATAVTNTHLDKWDNNNDTDVNYDVTAGNLTVESNSTLRVNTGDTFLPGGKINTHVSGGALHLDDGATATIDTATSTVGADINIDDGAVLNINAHTEVKGGNIITAGSGALNYTSGTPRISIYGSGSLGGGAGTLNFYDLTALGIGTLTLNSTTSVFNVLEAGQKTWKLVGAYEPLSIGQNFIASSSTFKYEAASNATVTPATYYNLEIVPSAGSPTFLLGTTTEQTIIVQNNFTVGGAGNAVVDANNYDPVLDFNGNFTVGVGDTFLASDLSPFTLAGDFANNGAFTHNNGAVILDTTNTSTVTSVASMSFYNLTSVVPGKTILFQAHSSDVPTFIIANILTVTGAQ
ncbi:MAG: hypothetical protein AAB863_02355, partial [Patescibacteria group bacterium]